MLTSSDNELLTRTDAGTAMGEYFRRFWQPIALSREIAEPDCPPIHVKVMGEDLVAFRDTKGRVGLIEPHCAHRGANLFFGRNEDCGIRCIYHGWKYDVNGKCVDLPNVPPGSRYHDTISIKAYPTREFGEIVWAYLGPPEHMPESVPQLEFGMLPPSQRYVTKRLQQCNWAHSMEGALDTAHFSFLHMPAPRVASYENPNAAADERRLRWLRNDPMPQFSILEHEVGFVVGGSRRADGEDLYWRITQFMLPAHSVTRLPDRPRRPEAPDVHGRARRRGAGRAGPGQPGRHRRPHARASHPYGRADRALSPHDAGRSESAARRQGARSGAAIQELF